MRNLLLAILLAGACGGAKSTGPSNTTTDPAAAPAADPAAATKPGDGPNCCCELPADEPVYETQVTETCQTDSHGVCVEEAKCTK